MSWGAVIGAAGAIGGSLISKKSAKDSAEAMSKQGQLDPRIASVIFGENGQQGLINRYQGLLDAPQSDAMKGYGDAMGAFLGNAGADMAGMRNAAQGLMSPLGAPQAHASMLGGTPQMSVAQAGLAAQSAGAPQVSARGPEVLWNKGETFNAPQAMQAAQATAAQVQQPAAMQAAQSAGVQMNLPSQNGVSVSSALDSLINGVPGSNPFLTGAIGKAINQSSNAFSNMLTDAKSATQDLLGGIRGGAMMSGQFGGSRQGLAEAKGIDSFNTNVSRAATQFGQHNTDAAVAAQASAYDADRNRQLAAAQGLSAQQYGAAAQQATMAQQNNQFNAGQQQQANATTYGGQLSGALANAGYAQQTGLANQAATNAAAQTNYAGQLQTNQQNAANLQQANLANQVAGNSASQFGAAASNAASLANAQLGLNNNQFNAGQQNNLNQFNAGLQQQTNQYNTGLQMQTGLANQGAQQQTNMANLQALIGTNQLNSGRTTAGLGALSGLLGTALSGAANQDAYALNRAQGVNSLLSPYLTGVPTQNPVSANTGSAMLGGGLAGLSLGNSLAGMLGGGTSSQFTGEKMGTFMDLPSLFGKNSVY